MAYDISRDPNARGLGQRISGLAGLFAPPSMAEIAGVARVRQAASEEAAKQAALAQVAEAYGPQVAALFGAGGGAQLAIAERLRLGQGLPTGDRISLTYDNFGNSPTGFREREANETRRTGMNNQTSVAVAALSPIGENAVRPPLPSVAGMYGMPELSQPAFGNRSVSAGEIQVPGSFPGVGTAPPAAAAAPAAPAPAAPGPQQFGPRVSRLNADGTVRQEAPAAPALAPAAAPVGGQGTGVLAGGTLVGQPNSAEAQRAELLRDGVRQLIAAGVSPAMAAALLAGMNGEQAGRFILADRALQPGAQPESLDAGVYALGGNAGNTFQGLRENNAAAQTRVDTEQAGATARTGMEQAGQTERTGMTQAGETERARITDTGQTTRNTADNQRQVALGLLAPVGANQARPGLPSVAAMYGFPEAAQPVVGVRTAGTGETNVPPVGLNPPAAATDPSQWGPRVSRLAPDGTVRPNSVEAALGAGPLPTVQGAPPQGEPRNVVIEDANGNVVRTDVTMDMRTSVNGQPLLGPGERVRSTFSNPTQVNPRDIQAPTNANLTDINRILMEVDMGRMTLQRLRDMAARTPGLVGAVGRVQGIAQDFQASVQEAIAAFGQFAPGGAESVARNMVETARQVQRDYNPDIPSAQNAALSLAYLMARLDNPSGEVTRDALTKQLNSLGVGNLLSNNVSLLSRLNEVEQRMNAREQVARQFLARSGGLQGAARPAAAAPATPGAAAPAPAPAPAAPGAAAAAPAPAPAAPQFREGDTATNLETGERRVFRGGQWVPQTGRFTSEGIPLD